MFKELDTQANGEFVVPKVPAQEGNKSWTILINDFAEFKRVNKQHIATDPIVSLAWRSCTYSRSHQHKYDKLQQTHLVICNEISRHLVYQFRSLFFQYQIYNKRKGYEPNM